MLTSFITTDNFKGLSASYLYDSQINFLNNTIAVDGNLTTFFSPIFKETADFQNNNFSFLHLTKPISLSNITDFNLPDNREKTLFCGIKNDFDKFLTIQLPTTDDMPPELAQTMVNDISGLNSSYFFEIDLTHPFVATVGHLYKNVMYYLCFNPVSYNLRFLKETEFSGGLDNTKFFFYTYDDLSNTFTLQTRIRDLPFSVMYNDSTKNISVTGARDISFTNSNKFFQVKSFELPKPIEITNDWGSYEQTFNQNNLNINQQKSYFNIENNFLIHSEYENLFGSALKTNILTLKNQLNLKDLQGRGNVFIGETPTFYRNYNTIFSGRRQERGYSKLHLQYDSYSTPYEFKAGKTTWFSAPQNMYPFSRLNIKSTKLVENGSVAGNHPLKSDKVFKKLANYKSSSNQGDASGEQTGQWLCSWLSGGSTFLSRPVWVDRYYNPKKITPYQALSAIDGNITYISQVDCINIPSGVVDVPSSLTFEPGCLYAYSRIGKIDAINNIKALEYLLQKKNFDAYKMWNGSILDPIVKDNISTFTFDGTNYSYFDVGGIDFGANKFTISFWANSTDWTKPKGYEILGNYNDYGYGWFNHNTITPFLFYARNGGIESYNTDLVKVDTYDAAVSSFGNARFVLRRDALNTFHVITDTQNIVEYDIRETIVDATSAFFNPTSTIIHASNDEARGYILYSNKSLSAIDLVSNIISPISAETVIGTMNNVKEVHRLNNGKLAVVDGTEGIVRDNRLYFLSSGIIMTYDTITNSVCAVLGSRGTFSYFNIDDSNYLWAGDDNLLAKYGPSQENIFTVSLTAANLPAGQRLEILNLSFTESFYEGELYKTVLVTASSTDTTNALIVKLNHDGDEISRSQINVNGNFLRNIAPTNHNFNYAYLTNRYGNGNYTFKTRLYNMFNNEDIEIPSVTVNSADLDNGFHHFAVVLNSPEGLLKLYLDGELYTQTRFTPNKYNLTPIITNRIFAGATPFYNGLLLSDLLDRNKERKTSFYVKDLDIENLYLYSTELDRYDIGMHFKEKIIPNTLYFDIPSGRRNHFDVVSRYFRQSIPGSKSTLFNIYINDNILDTNSRDKLTISIINTIKQITPAYTKLNTLKWVTTLPSQSAEYIQPYFPGNTLTNTTQKS